MATGSAFSGAVDAKAAAENDDGIDDDDDAGDEDVGSGCDDDLGGDGEGISTFLPRKRSITIWTMFSIAQMHSHEHSKWIGSVGLLVS